MVLIYRKADGVVIGEHYDDSKAEGLAEQYGTTLGIRVIDIELNRAWLEKTTSVKTHETVWREWQDTLWRKADGETRRVAASPGEDWQMVLAGHYAGEHIGAFAPGPQWSKVQEEQWAEQTVRAGTITVDHATRTVKLEAVKMLVVETDGSIDQETRAAIRGRYSVSEELKMNRVSRQDPQAEVVRQFDATIGAEVEAGQARKRANKGPR